MKVLHLDDNPAWLEFLKTLFVAKKWNYKSCLSFLEALELLEDSKNEFNLLVADYNLPGRLTGVDLVLKAKQRGVDRVFMFTSAPEQAKKELREKSPDLVEEILFFKKGNDYGIFVYLDSLA